MRRISFLLNLPWTLVGMLHAMLCGPRRVRWLNGILFIAVARVRFTPVNAVAITWGHTVLFRSKGGIAALPHELVHVEQYDRWFGLQPFLYLCDWLWRFAKTADVNDAYRANRFECEANERHNEYAWILSCFPNEKPSR